MRSAFRIVCDSQEVARLPAFSTMQTLTWNLELETWNLESGISNLEGSKGSVRVVQNCCWPDPRLSVE